MSSNPWKTGSASNLFSDTKGAEAKVAPPSYEGPYLAVLDFEATCWENSDEHEIIEYPTVIVDIKSLKIIDKFECFVKPSYDSELSEFCKKLTTITQEQVDSGVSLAQAIDMHTKFMSKYRNSVFVTCGDWDLKNMLPRDAKNNGISLPNMYSKWINIKRVFSDTLKTSKCPGMPGMLSKLGLKLKGTHHRGIDDCVNIAQIAIALIKLGANLE